MEFISGISAGSPANDLSPYCFHLLRPGRQPYDLTGGFDNNNFNATWAADGQSFFADTTGAVGFNTLSGLATDGGGNLVITVTRSNHVTASGLNITAASVAVPEPSSLAMLGFATVGMLVRRRR